MNSVMKHTFSRVPRAEIQRSSFDRSHGYKTTFDAGWLVPFYVDEALPGDSFSLNATAFARLATPLKPVMDNMFMDTFFFAVPIRLIWENWERFNGAQDDPEDSTDYVVPQVKTPATTGAGVGTLTDYLGIPTGVPDLWINSLWHRAYNLVWNEWFRDQNIQDSVEVPKDDGPDDYGIFNIKRRGKRHDYFTSCLPFPQKGPDVLLPLGDSAPIVGTGLFPLVDRDIQFRSVAGGGGTELDLTADGAGAVSSDVPSVDVKGYVPAAFQNYSVLAAGLSADLGDATAATINAIREAFQVQRMYERDARGGTRYTEILKAHFGVTSPDARLQRPEYLGGGSSPVNIHPVAQTVPTIVESDFSPQGNLAGFGTVALNRHGFTKSFTEHCVLIGLVSVRADLTYQQGLNRMFSRRTRFDFYWPALSHLGEQAVLTKEIRATGVPAEDDVVFGYQERNAEYRYKPSQITGQFRSTYAQSLDYWHLAQEFDSPPTLSPGFIEEDPPIDRVIAVASEPHFLFDSFIKLKCARPMPVFGVPGLVDHF